MVYSVNRTMFTGLATGLDTNQIIRDLMRVERLPLDRLNQNRQMLEWQREDYREMNRLFTSFREKVDALRLQSGFSVYNVVSSNEAALTSSVVGRPSQSMYSVEVVQLAQAGKHASATFDFAVAHPGQKFSEAEGWAGDFTFSVNGVEFNVTGEDTVESVVVKLNEKLYESGFRAEIDRNNVNQIVLKSDDVHSPAEISVAVEDNNVLSLAGLHPKNEPPQQAKIVINGVTLTSDTNRFTYDGIQMDVKQMTGGQTVNLSISRDVDAIFEKVKAFVEAYNDLIAKVNEKLGENRYRDYPPLTDEQREQLSETEIEKWEERARSGLIKNDPLLSRALSDLRLDFYSTVEGVGHVSEIGITVGDPVVGLSRYRDGGKLYIDEAKLREAISNDPDFVMNLFTVSGTSQDEAAKYKETGIAKRVYDSVNRVISQLNEKAGYPVSLSEADNSLIGKQLRDLDERISDMERRLQQIEDRYWRQFTALEKAMERLNQQNAWLMNQLGSMQG